MKALYVTMIIQFITQIILCENPYRIIGLAPYNSIEEVRTKCKKLVKTYHPDKYKGDKDEARLKFDRIQKACKEIKDSRSDEKDDESGFTTALKKCILSCIVSLLIIFFTYYFIMFIYKFYNFTMKFFIVISLLFFIVDSFFAHYFEDEGMQYLTVFLMALTLVSFKWIKMKIFGNGTTNGTTNTN